MKRFQAAIALVVSLTLLPTMVSAATLAFDWAADPAYLTSWQNGNGIDDGSTRGQSLDGDIDGFGRAWGVWD